VFHLPGNDASNTEPLKGGSSGNTGAIISGVMATLVLGIIIILVVIGTLIFCKRRKSVEELQFQNRAKELDNPTYMEKMEWSESNGYSISDVHYNRCQRPALRTTLVEDSDYATVDSDYSTVN